MKMVRPNILVTGTPGTGKTTLSNELGERLSMNVINISEFARENGMLLEYDEELDTMVLDEDQVLDELEETMASRTGNIVEYHSSSFFPERWFDVVFVLTTDNSILFERLTNRNYNEAKIKNNITCEIMRVPLDEATESYPEEIVHRLESNTVEEMEDNLERIVLWHTNWLAANSE